MTVFLIVVAAIAADLLFCVCVGKWLKGRAPAEHERVAHVDAPVSVGEWKP